MIFGKDRHTSNGFPLGYSLELEHRPGRMPFINSTRAVIGFTDHRYKLENGGLTDANASMRPCLERHDDTGCVAVGVRAGLMFSNSNSPTGSCDGSASAWSH
jgi:hypothetical protein